MKRFTTGKQKIGELGETFAQNFLVEQGYVTIQRNFNCRFGEIDLIMKKGSRLHFIEVKTVVQKSATDLVVNSQMSLSNRELFIKEYRSLTNPFENISFRKKKKLIKTVRYYYLVNKKIPENFSIDGIGIILNKNNEVTDCKVIHNIIIQ